MFKSAQTWLHNNNTDYAENPLNPFCPFCVPLNRLEEVLNFHFPDNKAAVPEVPLSKLELETAETRTPPPDS